MEIITQLEKLVYSLGEHLACDTEYVLDVTYEKGENKKDSFTVLTHDHHTYTVTVKQKSNRIKRG